MLLAARYGNLVRFTWTDVPPVTVYRVYHATDRLLTDRALTLTSPSGTAENTEVTLRPSGLHFYRVHTVVDCSSEGP